MKTLISEDNDKVIYLFSHLDCQKTIQYTKPQAVVSEDGEPVDPPAFDHDEISTKDHEDWLAWLGVIE